jgi:Holliday junction DNA helicase RuvB
VPRPMPMFHGFAGQRAIVASLQDHCRGALSKNEALPHIQFGGPSGSGKTHLARAVAKEMGTGCLEFYASRQSKKLQLVELLAKVKKSDIVFIDEIHALPADGQELLYPAIDRLQVPSIDKETHKPVENSWVQIPAFTLIAATDQPGILRNALRQRIVLRYILEEYDIVALRQIVLNSAAELGLLLKPQAATRLAAAARGVPRRARHLLKSVHTVRTDLGVEVTKGDVDRHLKSLGIDHDNLTATDRRYLSVLRQRDGYMSLPNLARLLGVDVMDVQREVEPYLLKMGCVGITSRGRFLTGTGKSYVAERRLS